MTNSAAPARTITGIGTGRTLVGLAGRGILESRTPFLHEQAADAAGQRLVYALFDFTDRHWADEDLPALLDAAQRVGFSGLNITFPFKQAVIPLLDALSPGAEAIGAVNTVSFADGKRTGYNTDVSGFAAGFNDGLPGARPGRVLQLGCGGAGSATAHALLGDLGADEVLLFDPEAERAQALHAALANRFGAARVSVVADAAEGAARADGLLNASPVGMTKFPGLPLPAAAIEPRHWVADIVYFPLETAFLAEGRRKGCRVLDGGGMAVHQAADAYALFTGRKADAAQMRASFERFESPLRAAS